jgi:hypothetical protein
MLFLTSLQDSLKFFRKHPAVIAFGLIMFLLNTGINYALSYYMMSLMPGMPVGGMMPFSSQEYDPMKPSPEMMAASQSMMSDMGAFFQLMAVSIFVSVFIVGLMSSYVTAANLRFVKNKDLLGSLSEGLTYLPKMYLAYFIKIAVFLAFTLVVVLPLFFMIGTLGTLAGPVFGLLMLPGIVLMALMYLVVFIKVMFVDLLICIGNKGVVESFKISFNHSKGYTLGIAITFVILIILMFGFLLGELLLTMAFGFGGMSILISLMGLLNIVLTILLTPLSTVFFVMVYLDIKRQGTGKGGELSSVPTSDGEHPGSGHLHVDPKTHKIVRE